MTMDGSCCNCPTTTHCVSRAAFSSTEISTDAPGAEIHWVSGYSLISVLLQLTCSNQRWTLVSKWCGHEFGYSGQTDFTSWNFAAKCTKMEFVKTESQSTSPPFKEIAVTIFRPHEQCAPGKLDKSCTVGYTRGKATQSRPTKEQVALLHFRPGLLPSYCGSSRTITSCSISWDILRPPRSVVLQPIPRGKAGGKIEFIYCWKCKSCKS